MSESKVPIDCCLRICSSSSSSFGSSLGGRMPFLLRMSFHSVSAFGSLMKRKRRKHVTNSAQFIFLFITNCAVLGLFLWPFWFQSQSLRPFSDVSFFYLSILQASNAHSKIRRAGVLTSTNRREKNLLNVTSVI